MNAPHDPDLAKTRRMRIAADIVMDEISEHVDKELDRFSDGLEHMKKQMNKHMENIQQPGYFE